MTSAAIPLAATIVGILGYAWAAGYVYRVVKAWAVSSNGERSSHEMAALAAIVAPATLLLIICWRPLRWAFRLGARERTKLPRAEVRR